MTKPITRDHWRPTEINSLPLGWGQFGISPSGGLVVVQGLQPVGHTAEPGGLGAEAISATPAPRTRPPVTAANAVQIVGLLP